MFADIADYSDMEVELLYRALRALLESGEVFSWRSQTAPNADVPFPSFDRAAVPGGDALYRVLSDVSNECRRRGLPLTGLDDFNTWEDFSLAAWTAFRETLSSRAKEDF